MAFPVTLNGRTYTLADFEGQNYAAGFPDALQDFVTEAGTKVTAAASSATAAAASETAAAASAAAAAASVDAIEGFYLGAQASNPTVDLNGAPVTVGDFYFNTATNQTRIYDGSSWNVIAPDLVGDASPQLGGTLDFNGNIATSFESTGIDDNATSTAITIDSSQNVGIGTTSIDSGVKIHVEESSASLTAATTSSVALFERAGNAGISIGTANTGESTIFFQDTDSATIGRVKYDHADDSLGFWANGSERARIDSSGNVGIGTTSPDYALEIEGSAKEFRITDTGTNNTYASVSTQPNNAQVVVARQGANKSRAELRALGNSAYLELEGLADDVAVLASESTGDFTISLDDGVTDTEFMRFDASSGNVGIGTTNPLRTLHVNGTSSAQVQLSTTSIACYQAFENTNSTATNAVQIGAVGTDEFAIHTGNTGEKVRVDSSGNVDISSGDLHVSALGSAFTLGPTLNNTSGDFGIKASTPQITLEPTADGQSSRIQFSKTNGTLWGSIFGFNDTEIMQFSADVFTFKTSSTERMRIDSSGNVGIGESNPSTALDVSGGVTFKKDDGTTLILENSTSGVYAGNGTELQGAIYFKNNDSSGDGDHIGAKIESYVVDAVGRGNLEFYTGRSDTDLEKRMTVDSSGNVGIGGEPVSSIRRLMITDTGDCRVDIRSGSDTNLGAIDFSDTSNTARGQIIYDHSDDSLQVKTLSTERMRIDSSGNVGIGVTNPSYPLTVASSALGTTAMLLADTSAGNFGVLSFRQENGTTENGKIVWNNIALNLRTNDSTVLTFSTGGANERMRIDSSGRVLIGTSTEGQANADDLTIENTSGDCGITIRSATTGAGKIFFSDGTSGTAEFDGYIIYDHNGNSMQFGQGNNENMRIDSSGNLLVGQTNASTVVNGAYFRTNGSGFIATSTDCLMLNRQGTDGTVVDIRNDNTTVGTISISGSSTAYNTSSDIRLKENIVDAPAGNIDAIRVRSFDWKADGTHQTYGMIAQELVDVAPEAVSQGETEDDMWQVDYSKLVPMMIKEIQDLKAEVAALKGE